MEELKKKGYEVLKDIVVTDYNDHLSVVYILYGVSENKNEFVSTNLDAQKPELDTVVHIYASADWYEREISEMFGIKVKGREIRRLLLEEWNGIDFPLRKSFAWGSEYRKR